MASIDWAKIGRSGLRSSITSLGRTADGYNYTGLPSQSHGDSFDELRFVGQTQGNNQNQNQVGVTQSLRTVAGRVNETKPSGAGEAYVTNPNANAGNDNAEQVLSQRSTATFPIVTGGPTNYYKMQGWYAFGSTYETWIAVGTPNSSPPSGHTLTSISVVGKWSQ